MINIDLDGVGADWEAYVLKHHFPYLKDIEGLNKHPYRTKLIKDMYLKDPHLFSKLSPLNQFGTLLNYVISRNLDWRILTAAGSDHHSFNMVVADKLRWLKKNFDVNFDRVVILKTSGEKRKYAGPTDILIDDYALNINEWVASGGIGVHVDGGTYCVNELLQKLDYILNEQ